MLFYFLSGLSCFADWCRDIGLVGYPLIPPFGSLKCVFNYCDVLGWMTTQIDFFIPIVKLSRW